MTDYSGPRPHYQRTARASDGNAQIDLTMTVTLVAPGTTTPISASVYDSPTSTVAKGSSWQTTTGVVDFYLAAPMVLDILLVPADAGAHIRYANQWVGVPGVGDPGMVHRIVQITQEDYEALSPPDPTTLYAILLVSAT